MDPLLAAFESFLRGKGLRFTEPRRQILEAVRALHEHFTAEEPLVVCEGVTSWGPQR